jgi:hypothetical protein
MNDKNLNTFIFVFDPKHYDMLSILRTELRMNSNEIIEMMIERLYKQRNEKHNVQK